MQTVFRGRHFITLQDYTNDEIETMLEVSKDLKKQFAMGVDTPYLLHKSMFLT
jgi:ornithine carbamoyltransferase